MKKEDGSGKKKKGSLSQASSRASSQASSTNIKALVRDLRERGTLIVRDLELVQLSAFMSDANKRWKAFLQIAAFLVY